MTITVEDGTNVPDANSFVSVAELVTYAQARGISLPETEPEQEVLLIKAMDYIEVSDKEYKGYRTFTDQELSWPRTYDYQDLGIPEDLKKAQMVLAVAAMTVDFFPNSSGLTRSTKKTVVGPISVEYATSSASRPRVPQAETLLSGLYNGYGAFGQLRVIRA